MESDISYLNSLIQGGLKFNSAWILATEPERQKMREFALDILYLVEEKESEICEISDRLTDAENAKENALDKVADFKDRVKKLADNILND